MKVLLLGERLLGTPDGALGTPDGVSAHLPPAEAARLTSCWPSWKSHFRVEHLWHTLDETPPGKTRIQEVLDTWAPDVLVSLGITVSLLLDVPYETPWLSITSLPAPNSSVSVLKFPHLSSRARAWRDPALTSSAQEILTTLGGRACSVDSWYPLEKSRNRDESEKDSRFPKAPVPLEISEVSARSGTPNSKSGPETHELKEKFYKTSREYSAECSCGWSVVGRVEKVVKADAAWHLDTKTKGQK